MSVAELSPLLTETAGPLLPYLEATDVIEICCNPGGKVFVERFGQGKRREPDISSAALDMFLASIAPLVKQEWRETSPSLHAALPGLGWRIQAERSPIAQAPMCTIRKHPQQIFPLSDFLAKGILTQWEHDTLVTALHEGQTLLISGATGSAKTTLINALLHALKDTDKRIVILEDDPELRSEAEDTASLQTSDGENGTARVMMADLVIKAMRHKPEILVIGEVRDGAALSMLKAWNTGHQGIGSVHAESAIGTLLRLEQLVQEVSASPQRELIAEAVDLIVHMQRQGRSWRCSGMVAVEGLTGETYCTRYLKEQ